MLKTKIQKITNNKYELIGHLDADSIPELLVQTQPFNELKNETVIIDLKAVTHSSSAGIALLLEWLRQANNINLELQFVNMPVKMKAIVEICGLSDILPIIK
ncbi:MAG: lipid asymmetry maintenance protein MlaB [Gammaproteobacteria bacterium]